MSRRASLAFHPGIGQGVRRSPPSAGASPRPGRTAGARGSLGDQRLLSLCFHCVVAWWAGPWSLGSKRGAWGDDAEVVFARAWCEDRLRVMGGHGPASAPGRTSSDLRGRDGAGPGAVKAGAAATVSGGSSARTHDLIGRPDGGPIAPADVRPFWSCPGSCGGTKRGRSGPGAPAVALVRPGLNASTSGATGG